MNRVTKSTHSFKSWCKCESHAAAVSRYGRCARAMRSRHDATCTRCNDRAKSAYPTAYLEVTQKLDVRGVRVLLRQNRQQRLVSGPDATCTRCNDRATSARPTAYLEEMQQLDVRGVRGFLRHNRQQRLVDQRELQAGTALQRWMRCSCCAAAVKNSLWARGATEALRSTASSAPAITTNASALARCALLLVSRACAGMQHASCETRHMACNTQHATCYMQHPRTGHPGCGR